MWHWNKSSSLQEENLRLEEEKRQLQQALEEERQRSLSFRNALQESRNALDELKQRCVEQEEVEALAERWTRLKQKYELRISRLELQLEDTRKALEMLTCKDRYGNIAMDELDAPCPPVLPEEAPEAEVKEEKDDKNGEKGEEDGGNWLEFL